MSDLFEVQLLLTIVRKHWWKVILGALVGGILGYGFSRMQIPVYQATTSVMVGRSIQASNLNRAEIQTSQELVLTYADIVRRQPVLQATIDALQLPMSWSQLRSDVRVELVSGTQLLEIQVEADSPEAAQRIADELAYQLTLFGGSREDDEAEAFARQRIADLQTKISEAENRLSLLETQVISETSSTGVVELQSEINVLQNLIERWEDNYAQLLNVINTGQAVNDLVIVERAQAGNNPIRPQTRSNTLIALVIGFIFTLGLVFSIELLDSTLKTPEDLAKTLHLAPLGAISQMHKNTLPHTLVLNQNPFSPAAEDYRVLRSKLQLGQEEGKTLLFTSAMEGEGKSITVANLGIMMAQAGYKTIIIDANLRQPMQHQIFQVQNKGGLSALLCKPNASFDPHFYPTLAPNLHLLVSGEMPNNPSELLGFERMAQLLKDLKGQVDVILLDSPQALSIADALVLAKVVDDVIFIVAAGRTPKGTALQAVENLRAAGANLAGGVVNYFVA